MTGFEPATSSTQNTHATKLRHIPVKTHLVYFIILKTEIQYFFEFDFLKSNSKKYFTNFD